MKWLQLGLFVLFIISAAWTLRVSRKSVHLSKELEQHDGVIENTQQAHLARAATAAAEASFACSAFVSVIMLGVLSWLTFQAFFP